MDLQRIVIDVENKCLKTIKIYFDITEIKEFIIDYSFLKDELIKCLGRYNVKVQTKDHNIENIFNLKYTYQTSYSDKEIGVGNYNECDFDTYYGPNAIFTLNFESEYIDKNIYSINDIEKVCYQIYIAIHKMYEFMYSTMEYI